MPEKSYIPISDCECVAETAKALLIVIEAGDEFLDEWFPKSQINMEEGDVHKRGDKGVLVCSEWIAEQKEIEKKIADALRKTEETRKQREIKNTMDDDLPF